jgi:predicted dinucleotide-binding enzyme
LYGANSSESAIGMKADAIYQQIPFNDGSNNYIMNVVQVFSQNCAEMMKQTSESQTTVLYAGDSDVKVGKHYLISDSNQKLCPIGNMDMSKFIESVGATQ